MKTKSTIQGRYQAKIIHDVFSGRKLPPLPEQSVTQKYSISQFDQTDKPKPTTLRKFDDACDKKTNKSMRARCIILSGVILGIMIVAIIAGLSVLFIRQSDNDNISQKFLNAGICLSFPNSQFFVKSKLIS